LEAASLGIAAENRTDQLAAPTVATGGSAMAGTLYTGEDEVFAFARSRSRLLAMQSRRYVVLSRGYA
jgi:predicted ATPase